MQETQRVATSHLASVGRQRTAEVCRAVGRDPKNTGPSEQGREGIFRWTRWGARPNEEVSLASGYLGGSLEAREACPRPRNDAVRTTGYREICVLTFWGPSFSIYKAVVVIRIVIYSSQGC